MCLRSAAGTGGHEMSWFPGSVDRQVWRRFVQTVRSFAASEAGTRAKLMLAVLVGLSVVINGLNVVNSYVGRDFFTSIDSMRSLEITSSATERTSDSGAGRRTPFSDDAFSSGSRPRIETKRPSP